MHRSSRGLGHRPFTAATRVQIPYGVPKALLHCRGAFCFLGWIVAYSGVNNGCSPWFGRSGRADHLEFTTPENMQGALLLACMNMGLSIEEATTAATLSGAHALRMGHETGLLEGGKRADVVYHFGVNHAFSVWAGGEEIA